MSYFIKKLNRKKNKNTLSVVNTSKNKAINILELIKSAQFGDDFLVLDSGRQDKTVKLSLNAGAKVNQTDWSGHGPQQNRADELCKVNWIYPLDVVEGISIEPANEILDVIKEGEIYVINVPRKSFFINKFIKHSDWWPCRTWRLFVLDFAKFTTREIRANLPFTFPVGH